MIVRILYGFVLFSMIAACEVAVPLEVPYERPLLVVNADFTENQPWIVRLTHSVSINSVTVPRPIANATIEIYQGNVRIDSLSYMANREFYYSQNHLPLAGTVYTLKASAPGYPPVEAQSMIPLPAQVANLSAKDSVGLSQSYPYNKPVAGFRFDIADDGLDNYYYYALYYADTVYDDEGKPESLSYRLYDDYQIEGYASEFTVEGVQYIGNATFKGQQKPVRLRAMSGGVKSKQMHLFIGKLSKEYYEYSKTRHLNSLETPFFSEKPPMSNYIRGGIGVFAGYSNALYPFVE